MTGLTVLLAVNLSHGQTALPDSVICQPIPTFKEQVRLIEQGVIDSELVVAYSERVQVLNASNEVKDMQIAEYKLQAETLANRLNEAIQANQKQATVIKRRNILLMILTGLSATLILAK